MNFDIANQENLITEAMLRGEVYSRDRFHQKIGQINSLTTKLAVHGGDRHGGDRKSGVYKYQAG